MLCFLIRLDDATPKMNKEGWRKVEDMLDKYGIKPIVGIIPDSQDSLFIWDEDPTFWTQTVKGWQKKGWTIAQHGYHHIYRDCGNNIRSEFVGLSYCEQMDIIRKGYASLKDHDVEPECFFAPAHTFDQTTVDVCRDSGYFKFISDGYGFFPYCEQNMLFIPSIFDTAHKILPFGVYTFILHPSFTTDKELEHFDRFISRNQAQFMSVQKLLEGVNPTRQRNVVEKGIQPTMKTVRKIRTVIRGFLNGK